MCASSWFSVLVVFNVWLGFCGTLHFPSARARSTNLRPFGTSPHHVMLHFDEAYYEFGQAAGGPETLPILHERKGPWISTRTFSKAYGLAGARVGYGLAGTPELALSIRKVRPNFSLSGTALAAGLAALNDLAYARNMVTATLSEAARMAKALRRLHFRTFEGSANFIAMIPPLDGDVLVAKLKDRGIYISSFPFGERVALRMTIGTTEQNDRLLEEIAVLLSEFDAVTS